jgi:inosine-uridine nucleoside N-ribohydrolase
MTRIPVILDTDIGTDIDDTWALAMLLNCPELEPRLILTACGDTIYRAQLTAKFLHAAGRADIPIGIGISNPEGTLKFQQPWLDGYDIDTYPGVIHPDGIRTMIEIIMDSPQPVTIVSIAAATNLARALSVEPRLARKCRFVGMHGSIHLGYGGVPGATPEANVRSDVPALRKVFAAPWLEKTITPLDTCGLVVLEGDRYQRVLHSTNPMLRALIENYEVWAKLVTWMQVDYVDTKTSTLFDTVAIYLAYSSELLEMEKIHLSISDDGLTLPDPLGDEVLAALRWRSLEGFYDHLVERLIR